MTKLISVIIIVALLLSLAPATVYAAQGGVSGQAKGGNTAPTVNAVNLVESGSENQVTAMTPLTEYRVKATIGDINTIDDIQEVEFHVYYNSDGNQWDADEVAIFKWTKGSGWTMDNGGAVTTWALVAGDCIVPSDMTATTGDWYLAFRPGAVARADAAQTWYASVTARDENKNASGQTAAGASMGSYAEISFDAANIVFGDAALGIEPGQSGVITSPASQYITARVKSNKTYALAVNSVATWDDGGSNTVTLSGSTGVPAGSGQFSLEVADQTSGSGVPKPAVKQAVTNTNATLSGHASDARVTTTVGANEGTNDTTIYMQLFLSMSGIKEVTYSGTITFTVTN